MRVSKILFRTTREQNKDTEFRSQDTLVRAGYIRQLSSGIFTYLHFGQRSFKKIEAILHEEMQRIGGVEICMPVVHPADIWKKTNRWYQIDESLVRFKDRAQRDMVLAMTHEEVVASLCASEIDSYKQLPKLVYQIFTKFRDEARARGGLIRVREFTMKDSYSLDRDDAGLIKQYEAHYHAYFRIFRRAGLPIVAIKSDTGMMGGKIAHEYMYLTPIGEDTIFISDDGEYKANKEVATFKKEYLTKPERQLEKIYTPDLKTIADLVASLNITEKEICKSVLFTVQKDGAKKVVLVLVPGDMEVNMAKFEKILQTDQYKASTDEEICQVGAVPGFASAIGIDHSTCLVIADEHIANAKNVVVGANEKDYHFINAAYGRDFTADIVTDIVSAYDGALSPHTNDNQSRLKAVRGIEVGNIFQLGTRYTEAMGAIFTDEDGRKKTVVMGSYGIGVGRLLGCLAEEYVDDKGINLPISISPYEVVLVSLCDKSETIGAADALYDLLVSNGIDVLYDDRDLKSTSAGVKFADSELIGIPVRITISKRSIEKGGVEIKLRNEEASEIVPLDNAVEHIRLIVKKCFDVLAESANKKEVYKD